MAKKAICVGINKFANYPQFALNGCVNDAKDMASLCKGLLGFKASEVAVLTDAQATKDNIMAQLKAAVAAAKAGKISYLLFSLSSHGTQMADKGGDEPDGMDEAFVPYDIAQKGSVWDPARIISDDEFHDLFQQLPESVLLEVCLDGRYSGAFTYYLVKTMLATQNKLSRKAVVDKIRAELKGKFTQVPNLKATPATARRLLPTDPASGFITPAPPARVRSGMGATTRRGWASSAAGSIRPSVSVHGSQRQSAVVPLFCHQPGTAPIDHIGTNNWICGVHSPETYGSSTPEGKNHVE